MRKIALDIGGSNTRVVLFDKGTIVTRNKYETITDDFEKAVNKLADEINSFDNVDAIGISAPGPADYKNGIFGELPNLPGWKNKNLIKALKEKTSVNKIFMENDANLMALAHHNHFKNQGGVTQFFTVSTGLGAGLVINDEVFTGANGFAQEMAFAPLAWKKESGKGLGEGSFELFASGSGISYRAGKQAKDVFSSKDSKDVEVINDGIETLANAIATVVAVVNPNLMVFDGSVTRYNKWYIEKAWELAKQRSYKAHFENLEMKIAELGDDAGLYGAYELVKNK